MQNSLVHTGKHVYTIHVLCTRSLTTFLFVVYNLAPSSMVPYILKVTRITHIFRVYTRTLSGTPLAGLYHSAISPGYTLYLKCTVLMYFYFVSCGPIHSLFIFSYSVSLTVRGLLFCTESSVLCVHCALYT
jgi:hypothetical protein